MPEPFDFSDTSDLPEELQNRFNSGRMKLADYVEVLKKAKVPLSVLEIRAVLYRKTGILVSGSNASSAIHRLKKNGKARQAGYGKWEIA